MANWRSLSGAVAIARGLSTLSSKMAQRRCSAWQQAAAVNGIAGHNSQHAEGTRTAINAQGLDACWYPQYSL